MNKLLAFIVMTVVSVSAFQVMAGCKKGALKGTWNVYADTGSNVGYCVLKIGRSGKIQSGTPCENTASHWTVRGGKLKVFRDCTIKGTINNGWGATKISMGSVSGDVAGGLALTPRGNYHFTAFRR